MDSKIRIETRKKFTLTTLIGHYILPWHLKSTYISRPYDPLKIQKEGKNGKQYDILFGNSTLLTDEVAEMEAHQFAFNILIPTNELTTDFIDKNATIDTLKDLADKKYKVSLFVLLNRLVEFADEKFAVVQSQNSKIIKTFQGKRTLVSFDVDNRSKAASFFRSPSAKEEIREGYVPASCWVIDAKENEEVFEQSIFNPEIGRVLTLLTFKG